MTMALTLAVLAGCKQTAEDRYQRYLDEVADSTTAIEFITPEKDPVAPPTNEGADPFPEIPQEREVNMNANTYELEKMMQGRE